MTEQGVHVGFEQSEELARELGVVLHCGRRGLSRERAAALRARVVDRWQEYAACAGADPEAWFPDSQGAAVPPAVVRICARCPVRRSCLATALLWAVEGTWAGTTEMDRREIVQLLKAGAPVAEVITSALDRAEGRVRRGARHRDWFHTEPPERTEVQGRPESDQPERTRQPGAAA